MTADPTPDAPPKSPLAPRSRKGPAMILAIILIGEGLCVFFLTKAFNSSPAPAFAEEPRLGGTLGNLKPADPKSQQAQLVEVDLGECRPSNRATGKLISFQIRVAVLVNATNMEQVKSVVDTRQGRIRDRINFVFRSAEPSHLNEPGMETLKRRIKNELERVLETPDLVEEVIIPEMLQTVSGV